MEYTDWSPQSIITLVAGLLATSVMIAATAYAFTKGGQRTRSDCSSPSMESISTMTTPWPPSPSRSGNRPTPHSQKSKTTTNMNRSIDTQPDRHVPSLTATGISWLEVDPAAVRTDGGPGLQLRSCGSGTPLMQ